MWTWQGEGGSSKFLINKPYLVKMAHEVMKFYKKPNSVKSSFRFPRFDLIFAFPAEMKREVKYMLSTLIDTFCHQRMENSLSGSASRDDFHLRTTCP